MIEVEDNVGFDGLDKRVFIGLCTTYSLADSLINHPFAVGTAVAELHKSQTVGHSRLLHGSVNTNPRWSNYNRFGLSQNLSLRQSLETITRRGCMGTKHDSRRLPVVRCLFTGFPINFVGLLSGDLCQMVAYNYVKTRIEDGVARYSPVYPRLGTHLPIPAVSGFIAMSMCAIPINAATVIFRHQIQQRVGGNNHSVFSVLTRVIPKMEGGLTRVLLRGTLASSAANIPSAAIGWQVYESSKEYIRNTTGSHSLWTSLVSGGLAGGIDVLLTRPLSVVLARSQTNPKHEPVMKIAKSIVNQEGYGALYKGLGAQMTSSIPRMAVFYGLYSTFVTWARNVSADS
jgi:hypothetical protein